jgi:8-oxo-dGTP pyrophosphatase MutT (NUDIX family)
MLPLQQKSSNISNILKVKMTMEKKQSVIGIGEALFDMLPEGKKLGGAPANFAYHVSQFVFVRQYRYAIGKTVNELCAGVIEKGEDPMVAAKRELMEETGFGGGNWQKWMTISANPSTHTNLTHCYLATDVERMDVQHLDQAEDIEVRLFSREEVMEMLEKGEIWQSLMAAPLWKYFAKAK